MGELEELSDLDEIDFDDKNCKFKNVEVKSNLKISIEIVSIVPDSISN